jgi:hypothetical protein
MYEINSALYLAYDGFADKRLKKLDRVAPFQIDDRNPGDISADGSPLMSFCRMSVTPASEDRIDIRLWNAPVNEKIIGWVKKHGGKVTQGIIEIVEFPLERGEQAKLGELAALVRGIVARGAPHYETKSYKYSCPRVAGSLEKLKRVLDGVWKPGSQRSAIAKALFD